MKAKLFLSLPLLMLSATTMAQTVNEGEALDKALNFLQSKHLARGQQSATQLELSYKAEKNGETYYYIFNDQQSGAFVIVAGDERATEILGYGDQGCLDFEQAPANFRWWMSQYEAQIHAAIQQDLPAASARRAPRRAPGRTDVPELVQTKWNQSTPYNNLLPSLGSGVTGDYALATGCVATAMAQVMYVHRCPASKGFGSNSYTGINGLTFEADFGNTTYDWNNMLLDYKNVNYNSDEANAVATLMYHCGVSVNMKYGQIKTGGSGASSSAIPHALSTYFGYDKSAQCVQRNYYTDEEWIDLVYSELKAGRPLLYGGQDAYSNSGHEFVCHGYKAADNTFAINWGWGGQLDGYFTLIGVDGLQPEGTGIGGAGEGASYTVGQDIIINVMPDQGTTKTPLVMYCIIDQEKGWDVQLLDASNNPVTSPVFDLTQPAQTLSLSFYPWNRSGDTRTFETSLMFREVVTGATFYAANKNTAFTLGHTFLIQQTVSFSSTEFDINGTYEVLPVVREAGETEWQRLRLPTSVTTPTVTITGGRSADKVNINFAISGTTVEEHGTLTITHDKLYNGDITYSATPAGIVSIDDEGVVTALQAGTVTITATGEEDAYFLQTSKDFVVEVTPYVKKDIHFTISDTNVRISNTLTITHDAGSNYTGTISYTSSADAIATVDASGKVTGVAAGRATITATAPADELYNLSTQSFDIVVTADGIAVLNLNIPNNGYFAESRWFFSATVVNNSNSGWGNYYLKCNIPYGGQNYLVYSSELIPFSIGDQATGFFDIQALFSGNLSNYFRVGDQVTTSVMDYDGNVISDVITFTFCNELSIDYTLSAAGWGTLCLPFEAEVPAGLTAYKVTGTNGTWLVKEEVDFLQMNTPYLISGAEGTYHFVGPDTPTGTAWKAGVMVGNTAPSTDGAYVYAPKGSYVLQMDGEGNVAFFVVENDDAQRIRQYSAYVQLPAGNNGLCYSIGSANGIEHIGADLSRGAAGYRMDGTRVNGSAQGIFIQNGKIMFNKQ